MRALIIGLGSCSCGETDKSYNLPTASWRTRKANDIIQFKGRWWCNCQLQAEGLRTMGYCYDSQGPMAKNPELQYTRGRKDRCPNTRREKICPFFTVLFHSGPKSTWLTPVTPGPHQWADLCTQLAKSNVNLFQKRPQRHIPKWSLPAIWTSLSRAKLIQKCNHQNHRE